MRAATVTAILAILAAPATARSQPRRNNCKAHASAYTAAANTAAASVVSTTAPAVTAASALPTDAASSAVESTAAGTEAAVSVESAVSSPAESAVSAAEVTDSVASGLDNATLIASPTEATESAVQTDAAVSAESVAASESVASSAEASVSESAAVYDASAASTTASSAAASSTSASSGTYPPALHSTDDSTEQYVQELLTAHNDFRAQYGASALVWNASLADTAAGNSAQCVFEHNSDINSQYGQNIAAGSVPTTLTDLVNAWTAESSLYDWSNPVYSDSTGHFTQVVWKDTTSLGCSWTTCTASEIFGSSESYNGVYLVCNYYAPGNYEGEFAANVGTKSS
ncbi:uncharacterized protein EHS24_000010 [Apiotrichum porosum]|uniref:SCP domain-containing protein n=1 Tax=Apiotrichum porosum TaxID=105984 RepID=A0A427Y8P7_9TREE|nr:uncharacterized protein EHS24_000010 [Apiotrichum porosum]RSH87502.1 hypothetical protein EHS24_000010 [Apiotrichum porosum]